MATFVTSQPNSNDSNATTLVGSAGIAVQAGDSVNVRFQDLGTVGMRFV